MIRFVFGLALAASLVSCDTASGDDAFSLNVSVQSASGAPVSGLTVALETEMGSASGAKSAGSSALFEVSAPFPNPSASVALIRLGTFAGASGEATVEVVDLEGRMVESQAFTVSPNQSYQQVVGSPGGRPLAGGVYRVRTALGGESVERGMIRTEGFQDGRASFLRVVGQTDAGGSVRSEDRTTAPALYADLPALAVTDEQGSLLGTARVPRTATVIVSDGTREVRESVTLRDGANEVRVRW